MEEEVKREQSNCRLEENYGERSEIFEGNCQEALHC